MEFTVAKMTLSSYLVLYYTVMVIKSEWYRVSKRVAERVIDDTA